MPDEIPTDLANQVFDASPSEPEPQLDAADTQQDPAPPDAPNDFAPVTDTPAPNEDAEEGAAPEGDAPAPAEAPPTDAPKSKRDYSEFPAEEHAALKQMSNAAFQNHVAKHRALKAAQEELATLKSKADPNKLPDSYYEHEDGYTLSPNYKEAAHQISRADAEARFVEQQLSAVSNGEKFFLPGWVDGKLVPMTEVAPGQFAPARSREDGIEPTKDWERRLERALTNADRIRDEAGKHIATLQTQFKAEHDQAKSVIKQGIQQLAPWSSKPEDPVTKWAENYRKTAIPKIYRDHPLAESTAHSIAWGLSQQQRADRAEKEAAALKALTKDIKKAPPVPTRGRQPARTSEKVMTLEDFK